jgi:arabinan endo-1,5-alpha-L-arabinosidase
MSNKLFHSGVSAGLLTMKKNLFGLQANGVVTMVLVFCFQLGICPESANGASTAWNVSVTASNVAPFVRNAFVHDPSTLIKCKDEFWVFTTGRGVPSLHSKDLVNWERGPAIFSNAPPWVAQAVPANRGGNFWAPDVTYLDGRYLIYYSASSFGKCVSGIGLVTSPTLDPNDPAYGWTDQGLIVASAATDDFNAIDPAIFHDTNNGTLWLTFGSFWSGIKMIQLDPQTGKRIAPDSELYSLAHYDSIEASYLYQHNGYYYLFVNWGMCCRGASSTYSIHVGRSKKVTGPYLDRDGKDMLYGGGTLFLDSTKPYIGPGHSGIIVDNGTNWFSCHYEAGTAAATPGQRRGGSPLAVMPLRWTADNWPQVDLK